MKKRLITREEFRAQFPDKKLTDLEVDKMITSLEQFARLTFRYMTMKN